MVITKREGVTKQGFCKILWRKLHLRGSLLLGLILFFFFGWEGWALINFFCLYYRRLFEVGANSMLGAYSNKYGSIGLIFFFIALTFVLRMTNIYWPKNKNKLSCFKCACLIQYRTLSSCWSFNCPIRFLRLLHTVLENQTVYLFLNVYRIDDFVLRGRGLPDGKLCSTGK